MIGWFGGGRGSHPEAGAVSVGSDHGEAISWQVASAHGEGDEAGEVPGDEVLQSRRSRCQTVETLLCVSTSGLY